MNTKELLQSIKTYGKQKVMLYKDLERIQKYVAECRGKGKDVNIIAPQKGFQEEVLWRYAYSQMTILSGSRGGGKTYIINLIHAANITKKGYSACLLRKGKMDGNKQNGINKIFESMYKDYVEWIDSKMTFKAANGNEIYSTYFGDALKNVNAEDGGGIKDFRDRFQGQSFSSVLIDEIAQTPANVIEYLFTTLRNAYGMKTHLIGACNPNPYSDYWCALAEYYIDPITGIAVPERSGKMRYYYQYGETIRESFFGSSYKEVWEKAKPYIVSKYGIKREIKDEDMRNYIKSYCFINADLADNAILNQSSPDYLSKLTGTEQEVSINALGSWKRINGGTEWLKYEDINIFFNNSKENCISRGLKRCTLDVAYGGEGSNESVLCFFIDHWLEDIAFTDKVMTVSDYCKWIRGNLKKWGVTENYLAIDLSGAPHLKTEFPNSVGVLRKVIPFKNAGKDVDASLLYYDLKAQLADLMVQRMQGTFSQDGHTCGYGINPRLLSMPYGNKTIKEAFITQSRCIKKDLDRGAGKFALIKKSEMKAILGNGESPDLIEAFLYNEIFTLKEPPRPISKSTLSRLRLF